MLFYFWDEICRSYRAQTTQGIITACLPERISQRMSSYPSWSTFFFKIHPLRTLVALSPQLEPWKLPIFPIAQTRSHTSYLPQLSQFVSLWLRLKCSCRIKGGCGEWQSALWFDYSVQYRRRVVVLLMIVCDLKKWIEGKRSLFEQHSNDEICNPSWGHW